MPAPWRPRASPGKLTLVTDVRLNINSSIFGEIERLAAEAGDTAENLINTTLANAFGKQHATIFQISTTNALVDGVHDKATTVGDLRAHGDFGVGTFAGLVGEMVVLDGRFICVPGHGPAFEAADSDPVPFAVVSVFTPDATNRSGVVGGFTELANVLDDLRTSENLFYAVRIRGFFDRVHTRAVCPVPAGTGLVAASQSQVEFDLTEVSGTIVGYWFPAYAGTLNVTGWHMHFITDDHCAGGHLLDLQAESLTIEFQTLDDLHVSLPETKEFMEANLDFDATSAIEQAEREH